NRSRYSHPPATTTVSGHLARTPERNCYAPRRPDPPWRTHRGLSPRAHRPVSSVERKSIGEEPTVGVFKRFERRLEGAVGNAFARVFGGKIVLAEVEDALQREADLAVRDVDGYPLAPNRYVLTVSEADLTNLTADTDLGLRAFARHLDGYIADQGWQTYGEVAVELESSGSLHTGQFRTHSAFDPDGGAQPAPMPAPSRSGAAPMADDPSSPRPSAPRPAAPQGRPDPGPQAAPPPR